MQNLLATAALPAALLCLGIALAGAQPVPVQQSGPGTDVPRQGSGESGASMPMQATGKEGSMPQQSTQDSGPTPLRPNASRDRGPSAIPTAGSLQGEDRRFVEKAARDGLAEVELARLAQQKAQSADVKRFADHLVQEHSRANAELAALAGARGVPLPAAPDAGPQRDRDRLARLSGDRFDREYMEHMVREHQKGVGAFRKQARSGGDAGLREFAAKTLPLLEQHLRMAQRTHAAVKGGGKLPTTAAPKAGADAAKP